MGWVRSGLHGVVLLIMAAGPAQAHRPYSVVESTHQTADGRSLMLERYYGDGIFFADPGRGQLRDERGAVVARTWVATGVTTLCPSLSYCWVFLNSRVAPLPVALRLDPAAINWQAPVTPDTYPELEWDKPPVAFVEDDRLFIAIAGLVMMSSENVVSLAVVALAWLGILHVMAWIRRVGQRQSSTAVRLVLEFLLVAAGLGLGVVLLAAALFPIVYRGYPLPPLLALLFIVFAAWLTIRRKLRGRPKDGTATSAQPPISTTSPS